MSDAVASTWKNKLQVFRAKSESEKCWNGDFTFIQGADTQFGFIDRYLLKLPTPCWEKEIQLLRDAIKEINTMSPKPKFWVICGDMLDAFPTEGEQGDLREKQLKDFNIVVESLDPDIPMVCVCGNHDIGDVPTRKTVQVYREQFGDDFYSFWVGGVKFVVLNSQYLKNCENVPEELERQNEMLKTIEDPSAVHIVMFQHIPFFINSPDEADDYFNIEKSLRLETLEKIRNAGVRYVFTGHYHRNAGGFYKDLEQVVTSAMGGPMGEAPSGFRIVNVTKNSIKHTYVATVDDK